MQDELDAALLLSRSQLATLLVWLNFLASPRPYEPWVSGPLLRELHVVTAVALAQHTARPPCPCVLKQIRQCLTWDYLPQSPDGTGTFMVWETEGVQDGTSPLSPDSRNSRSSAAAHMHWQGTYSWPCIQPTCKCSGGGRGGAGVAAWASSGSWKYLHLSPSWIIALLQKESTGMGRGRI